MRKSDTYGAQLMCEQSPLDLSLMTEKQTTVKQLSAPISQDAKIKPPLPSSLTDISDCKWLTRE